MRARCSGAADIGAAREELKALRDRNLDAITFEEKLDIVSRLGIKVYPSEDLKAMRVLCELNLDQVHSDTRSGEIESKEMQANGESESAIECRKVMFGPPSGNYVTTNGIRANLIFNPYKIQRLHYVVPTSVGYFIASIRLWLVVTQP